MSKVVDNAYDIAKFQGIDIFNPRKYITEVAAYEKYEGLMCLVEEINSNTIDSELALGISIMPGLVEVIKWCGAEGEYHPCEWESLKKFIIDEETPLILALQNAIIKVYELERAGR